MPSSSTRNSLTVPNDAFFALVEERLKDEGSVTFLVKGTSMRPFVEGGRDSVKITVPGQLEAGDAVLARLPSGACILHRIIRKDGPLLTLQGDGLRSRTESCTVDSVIGRVVRYIRPHRTLDADAPSVKLAVRLWMAARPLRRPLLFLYRKFGTL